MVREKHEPATVIQADGEAGCGSLLGPAVTHREADHRTRSIGLVPYNCKNGLHVHDTHLLLNAIHHCLRYPLGTWTRSLPHSITHLTSSPATACLALLPPAPLPAADRKPPAALPAPKIDSNRSNGLPCGGGWGKGKGKSGVRNCIDEVEAQPLSEQDSFFRPHCGPHTAVLLQ